ncbi:MAG TPA: L,D-transpeptidase [Elusimicrobiota bacterium]|nr:L,D-transpeptidase [Elusimicrobiota bacterium]
MKLDRRAPLPLLLAVGALLLLVPWELQSWLTVHAKRAAAEADVLGSALDDLDQELAERQGLRDLVARDVAAAKKNAVSLSASRRALFEGGLALSEEERLLEKQWEIMTTYLLVDVPDDRVEVMRGDQAFESWPLHHAVPRAVGGDKRPMPRIATIISKERFAHAERGKSGVTDGRLDWEPPQVGTSARARALGEHVLFTREGLIIHGPPLDKAAHEAYPHLCLTLPAAVARRVYDGSFIGTRVLIKEGPPAR